MRLRWCGLRQARWGLLVASLLLLLHTLTLLLLTEDPYHSTAAIHCQDKNTPKHGFEKIFHQIWTTEDVPEKWAKLQKKCIQMNQNYKYMLWTHRGIDAFMEKHYPWFMTTYWSYPYQMQRLDAARYFILYHYGGVYVDMDMECLDTFDNIFVNVSKASPTADIVLGATTPLGVTSSFLMAKQHHSFMEYITKRLTSFNQWYVSPYWTVLFSTGPLYLFRSTRSFPCREQIYIIPAQIHTKSYLDHKHASTWHSWDGPIMLWFERHGKKLIILGMFLIVTMIVLLIRRICSSKHSSRGTSHDGFKRLIPVR